MSVVPNGRSEANNAQLWGVLLFASFLLSAWWAFAVPLPVVGGEAAFHPDEASHIAVIRYMADHRAFPPYERPFDTSVHPPLYHAAATAVFLLLRPLAGTDGALIGLRLVSACLGTGVVGLTFLTARQIGLSRRTALTAAAVVLLIPTRASLSGAITNENLAAFGAAGTLYCLTQGLRNGFTQRLVWQIGLWCTLAIGSKITCIGLIPAAAVALFWGRHPRENKFSQAVFSWGIVVGTVLFGTGWWFVRNYFLYGDPLRSHAADQLWDTVQPGFPFANGAERVSGGRYVFLLLANGWRSFWGTFDRLQRWLPHGVYWTLALMQATAGYGLVRWGIRQRRQIDQWLPTLLGWGVFAAATFAIYLHYNWRHYTPQGRYFFVLLVPFGISTAVGLENIIPPVHCRAIRVFLFVCAVGMVVLNLWCLLTFPKQAS